MNLNKLAQDVTKAEGLKKQVNIAQVKEIMKILFTKLNKMTLQEIQSIINNYRK